MTYYPKIATLKFKDRAVNITMDFRVKKIEMVAYRCPHCMTSGTKTSLRRAYLKEIWNPGFPDDVKAYLSKWEYHNKEEGLPTTLYCPDCLSKRKSEMQETRIPKLTVYTTKAHPYIKIDEIVRHFLPYLNFEKRRDKSVAAFIGIRNSGKTELEMIKGDLKHVSKHRQNKFRTAEVKVYDDITIEKLDEKMKEYEMRKVARRI